MGIAAHAAVPRGQGGEIEVGVGVGLHGGGREVVRAEQLLTREKRRATALGADADDRVGLAVEHRAKCRVRVGDVEQGHVAQRLEGEEPRGTVRGLETLRREPGARSDREQLEEVAPRDVHALVADARHAERLSVVEGGQVEL